MFKTAPGVHKDWRRRSNYILPFSSCPVISTLIPLLPVCILINGFGNTLKRIPPLSSPKLFRQGDNGNAGSRT